MNFTTHSEIKYWIDQLDILSSAKMCSAPRFLKPFHFASICHILYGKQIESFTLPENIRSYANSMMLYEALGISPPRKVDRRDRAGKYHPIKLLKNESEVSRIAENLTAILAEICGDINTIGAIFTTLEEMISNCFAHSGSQSGVYGSVCAQLWERGNLAQIAIADSGIGIRETLNQNPKLSSRLMNENSCEMAVQHGITGKPKEKHLGLGLALAKELVVRNNGVFYLLSGNEYFYVRQGRAKSGRISKHWKGTLLIIEIVLNNLIKISDVWDAWNSNERMENVEFDIYF